jgi:hypothetical protein
MANLDDQVDKLEAAVDPNTVISVGGVNFTPAKLMIAGGILSSVLGGLYGVFEVYKDYMDMKEQIQSYEAPDLSGLQEQLSVIKKEMESTKASVLESTNYTNEIKNDLKQDIRRIEKIVDSVERNTKEQQRQVDIDLKIARNEMRDLQKELDYGLKETKKEINDKLTEALNNPLANN